MRTLKYTRLYSHNLSSLFLFLSFYRSDSEHYEFVYKLPLAIILWWSHCFYSIDLFSMDHTYWTRVHHNDVDGWVSQLKILKTLSCLCHFDVTFFMMDPGVMDNFRRKKGYILRNIENENSFHLESNPRSMGYGSISQPLSYLTSWWLDIT